METGAKRSIEVDVTNTDRAFGTILGAEITKKFYNTLPEDTYRVLCNGAGGQSFGGAIKRIKFSTYSGLPRNLLRSSGFWVATPTGQVSRLHTRIIKVYPWIAKTRHSTPGVGLISPPPHHDIYSIHLLNGHSLFGITKIHQPPQSLDLALIINAGSVLLKHVVIAANRRSQERFIILPLF